MPIELPDINVLIALADLSNPQHVVATNWLAGVQQTGWATCPATENGFIRIVSNPNFRTLSYCVLEAADALEALITRFGQSHQFWAEDVSFLDRSIFRREAAAGPGQISDVYLLGLCQKRGGTLVTLDQRITTAAIVDPHPHLLRVLS